MAQVVSSAQVSLFPSAEHYRGWLRTQGRLAAYPTASASGPRLDEPSRGHGRLVTSVPRHCPRRLIEAGSVDTASHGRTRPAQKTAPTRACPTAFRTPGASLLATRMKEVRMTWIDDPELDAPPSPKQGILMLILLLVLLIGFWLAGGDNAQVEQERRDVARFGQWRLQ